MLEVLHHLGAFEHQDGAEKSIRFASSNLKAAYNAAIA